MGWGTSPADSLSAAMKGRGVIEFKVHWRVGVWYILLFFPENRHSVLVCMFFFPLFLIYLCPREWHHGKFCVWWHEKRHNWGHWEHDGKAQHDFLVLKRCPFVTLFQLSDRQIWRLVTPERWNLIVRVEITTQWIRLVSWQKNSLRLLTIRFYVFLCLVIKQI